MDPAELRFLIDRSAEIHLAINNPKEVKQKVEEGQKFVKNNFTPEIITKQWDRVYEIIT